MSAQNATDSCKPTTSSPWGKTNPIKPCSLADVMNEQMSEELATELQNRENDILNQELQILEHVKEREATQDGQETKSAPVNPSIADEGLTDAELAAKLAAEEVKSDPNDELIALMLQKQFDREYDAALSQREQKYNGNCKVAISFDNFKRKHVQAEYQDAEAVDDDDDDFYEEELPQYPQPTQWDNGNPAIGNRGYAKQGGEIVTKHDKVICGRRNAQRLMQQFPADFESGDGEGMDMQLSNRVYNKLKQHSLSETKKSHKVLEKKDHSTAIKAVDEKTRILIFKMINSEFLTSVDGVVSEGKEAVVLKAIGGRKDHVELPRDVILKVYKTSMNEFKTRLKYIQGDYRLSKDILKKFNPRKLMKMWAEKEFLNLRKLRRHGVLCPDPLAQKKQILAMSCIGGESPAPKLKDVVFSTEDFQDAFEQTVELMKLMFNRCNMVHCDFSPYNLLWFQKKVWVIDVGQAVDRDNPNSNSFLYRDCRNISEFFKQGGVHGVPTAEGLFNEITNYSFEGEGKVFEAQVHRYDEEGYAFDFFFELSKSAQSRRSSGEEDSTGSESEGEGEEEEDDDADVCVSGEKDVKDLECEK